MAESELDIVLKLVDNATDGIKQSMSSLSDATKKGTDAMHTLGQEINSTGRELTRIGSTMTFVGGAIQAFFIKALTDASKNSLEVNQTLKVLGSQFEQFEMILAQGVIPVINQIINYFQNFLNAINSLPKVLRDQIIQWTFMVSIFVTLGGLASILAGKIFELVGNFLKLTAAIVANPFFLIIAALTSIIVLMFIFSDTTKEILNGLQAFFIALKEGFLDIKVALESFISSSLMNLSKLDEALANVSKGSLKTFFLTASADAETAANSLRTFATKDMKSAQDAALELQNIFLNKDGSWAQGFDNVKQHVSDLINFLKNLGTVAGKTAVTAQLSFNQMIQGASTALSALSSALSGAAAANSKFAKAAQITAIALAMINTAQGVTKALADYPFPYDLVVAGIVAAAGAIQIGTIASQSFAVGTPNVPQDMMAQIHAGETIIPATFADAIRSGQLTLSGGNSGSSDSQQPIVVNVYYPKMSNKSEVQSLSNQLGLEIQRQLRYAI